MCPYACLLTLKRRYFRIKFCPAIPLNITLHMEVEVGQMITRNVKPSCCKTANESLSVSWIYEIEHMTGLVNCINFCSYIVVCIWRYLYILW